MRWYLFLLFSFLILSCCKTEKPLNVDTIIPENVYLSDSSEDTPTLIGELETIIETNNRNDALKNVSVVIAMHDLDNDWSKRVVSGISSTLNNYGVSITLITDGEFSTEKQISDYRQILKIKPEILITLPLDVDICAPVLHEIAESGTKIAFIDALPKGFIPRKNCIGWAVGDSYTMGKGGAKLLANALEKGAEIVLLNWNKKMFTVDRRTQGARDFFKTHSDITVVQDVSFTEFYEIDSIVKAALGKYPKVTGFWAVWDTPAFEILKSINNSPNIKIVACDFSQDMKDELGKEGSSIVGTMCDNPYEIGEIEALMAIAALRGLDIPGYYVTPVFSVDRKNYLHVWDKLFPSLSN